MDDKDFFLALFAFFAVGGALWVIRPLVSALAKRLAGEARRATPDELAALRAEFLDEMQQVRHELGEIHALGELTELMAHLLHFVQKLRPQRGKLVGRGAARLPREAFGERADQGADHP